MKEIPIDVTTWSPDVLYQSPFLRLIPVDQLGNILRQGRVLYFDFGEVIVNEGDPGDAFYLILEGSARVIKKTPTGSEAPLQRLRKGDTFGEIALLSGSSRTATVRASEPTKVLVISRLVFEDLLNRYPSLQEFVHIQLQHRMLQGFLQQYTRFARTPLPVIQRILQFLKPVEFRKGDIIFREGDPGGCVYIIEKGRLMVYREQSDGEKEILAYLRPGDYFGELSLLEGMRRTATVEAITDVRLHQLSPEDWQAITEEYRELEQMVKERVARYKMVGGGQRVPLDFTQLPEAVVDDEEEDAEQKVTHSPPFTSRFYFIPQVDETDCGVAAFAMVCLALGREINPNIIRSFLSPGPKGTNARSIQLLAQDFGLRAVYRKYVPDQIGTIPTPAMLHFRNNHWVVLLDVGKQKIKIADPAVGIVVQSPTSVIEQFSGYALTFTPTSKFFEELQFSHLPYPPWKWIFRLFSGQVLWLGIIGIIAGLIAAGETVFPYVVQRTVDKILFPFLANTKPTLVFVRESEQLLRDSLLILFGVILLFFLSILIQRYLVSRVSLYIDRVLYEFSLSKLLHLPLTYFLNHTHLDLQRRLMGIQTIRNYFSERVIPGFLALIQLVVFILVMYWFHPVMTILFLLVMIPLYMIFFYLSRSSLTQAYETIHEAFLMELQVQNELLGGIKVIKASGQQDRFVNLLLSNILSLNQRLGSSYFNLLTYEGLTQVLWTIGTLLFIWFGSHTLLHGVIEHSEMSIGTFMAMLLISIRLYPLFSILARWAADTRALQVILRRVNEIIEWPVEQKITGKLRNVPSLQGRVEFRDCSVRLGGPGSPYLLANISFKAVNGQVIAIVGRSGSGKSLLAQTIATLIPPTSGEIFFDDIPVQEINLMDLRRKIGIVFPENHIFYASVKANIALGCTEIDELRVHQVARLVRIHDLIMQLPQQYDTILSSADSLFPPYLVQSIALARALYWDPAILILDQITAKLDSESRSKFMEILHDIIPNRTVFLIPDQLKLASFADLILVLDHGRIVERGNHEELMNRRGIYHHLYTREL